MSIQIPKTMKAIQVPKTGGPEVFTLAEIPVPTPKDHEVLIKVQWTTLPFTAGQDAVGVLVTLPKSSMSHISLRPLQLGQRVLTCQSSSFAEYMVAPWWQVAQIPEGIDSKEAVAMATTLFTAMYLVRESYDVKKGDWMLVRAAAGGVGLLLCQLGKYFGANVIGTVSTPEKATLAKSAGADHILLTSTPSEENVKTIMSHTGGKGVHVVYDSIGKDTWEEDFEVVRPKATIVTFGNSSGPIPPFAPLKLFPKALKVTRPTLSQFIEEPEDFARYATEIFDIVKKGGLKFSIHKVYPFTVEGVAQSQRDMASRGTTGKLLIHVSE
ncbi:hypothetical protein JCM24511_02080 [Saitozyma sp. JCM 24511]|nr:hypothetical protein JCM24511_02080 [Saitozyma sp. JCM 24511]